MLWILARTAPDGGHGVIKIFGESERLMYVGSDKSNSGKLAKIQGKNSGKSEKFIW